MTLWRRVSALVAFGLISGGLALAGEVRRDLIPLGLAGPYTVTYREGHLSDPVPFQLVRGVHPVVDVVVNGTTHLKLLVDSGATTVVLPPSIASPFLKDLCFANGVCFQTIVGWQPKSPYAMDEPGYINGLIGFNMLSVLPVTLDYQKRQLVFGRTAPATAARIPFVVKPDDARPFGSATIGGRVIKDILLDTGSSFVRLSSSLVGKLGKKAVPAGGEVAFSISKQEKSKLFTIASMCLGEASCVIDETAQVGSWQAIGATFFRHFRVTFDVAEGNLALEPYASPPSFVSAREKWGFQLNLSDASGIVQVDSGSAAAEAGMSTKDKLVAIDGKPISTLGYLGAHALLEAPGKASVDLDLMRGSKTREVVLAAN